MKAQSEKHLPHDQPAVKPAGGSVLSAYLLLLVGGALAYAFIRQIGLGLNAPSTGTTAASLQKTTLHSTSLLQVLVALVVVIVCSRIAGAAFRRINQPPVIGEVVAGIMLGPSLLGRIAPGVMESLFPPSVIPSLGILAQIGVLLFMFLIGVELDVSTLREQSARALTISHASIVVPFILGSALSLLLYPMFSFSNVSFTAFSLFMGVSMSVTAFPVLARILTDRSMQKTPLGEMALTCAAVGDATAWCLLAFVVGVAKAQLGAAAWTTVLSVIYAVGMVLLVRPLVNRWVARYESEGATDQTLMVVACVGLLLSCIATEGIGIHALFGAFLFGALIRHDSRAAEMLHKKLYDVTMVMLLPAFFALTGLRTQIGLVAGAQWLICGLIILVASAGKIGGTSISSRLTGLSWRDSHALGILMNTRGLMELIVLNVGLDLGVIGPRLFAMMVIMALVTTFATAPVLDILTRVRKAECRTG